MRQITPDITAGLGLSDLHLGHGGSTEDDLGKQTMSCAAFAYLMSATCVKTHNLLQVVNNVVNNVVLHPVDNVVLHPVNNVVLHPVNNVVLHSVNIVVNKVVQP